VTEDEGRREAAGPETARFHFDLGRLAEDADDKETSREHDERFLVAGGDDDDNGVKDRLKQPKKNCQDP